MGAIVKCLSDVKNIGEGRTEEMPLCRRRRRRSGCLRLALVVRQLRRLLLAPGETGQALGDAIDA